jgi:hypothetical protein
MGLSAREAAKALGVTHPTLLRAAKSGRITRENDGTYDVEKVGRQLAQTLNLAKSRKRKEPRLEVVRDLVHPPVHKESQPNGANRTFAEAQRRREWLRVKRDELALARERSELAPIGEINAWVAGMIIRAKEILMRMPGELKDRLAQQSNPHECERLMMGEVLRALNELAEFRPVPR